MLSNRWVRDRQVIRHLMENKEDPLRSFEAGLTLSGGIPKPKASEGYSETSC